MVGIEPIKLGEKRKVNNAPLPKIGQNNPIIPTQHPRTDKKDRARRNTIFKPWES